MDTFLLRLRIFLLPKNLLWLLLLVGGGGFLLIRLFGESQVANFTLESPAWEPVEVMIKERLAGRYSAIATGWLLSTIVFFWNYIGRQLRKAERMW